MYSESIDIYDKLYSFKNYEKEASQILDLIISRNSNANTLLDVACGTGKHLQYFKKKYKAEGIDISSNFISIAKKSNPDLEFYIGDMINFSIPKHYDVITCLFSSIGYVKTLINLKKTIKNFTNHLNKNGLLLIEPWFTPEMWHVNTAHATFINEPELKIARMSTSKAKGFLSIMEMHYLVSTPVDTKYYKELHQMGLFTKENMIAAFQEAELETEYLKEGITGRGLYISKRIE